MSRYFFHLRHNGEIILDKEGEEYATVADARDDAVKGVRELIATTIRCGEAIGDEHMDVVNEFDELQFSLSFHDVVRNHLR